ncbi:siphovirus Gp157 family protein [Paenibacillus dendritiformis]
MPNLYELAKEYKRFYDFMEAGLDDENLSEDDLQLYYDTLEAVETPFLQKAENVVKFLKNIEGDIAAYKNEKLRLEKKQKYLQNKYDGLKRWLKDSLELNKIDKVEAGMFKIRLQKNPASVEIIDEKQVPEQYVTKKEISFDKKLLLEEIKSGKTIDGVVMAPQSRHVRIS